MTTEVLLEWMTHVGSGRWASFRDAVGELFEVGDYSLHTRCRELRLALSDLGHADFFIGGTPRWTVRAPAFLELVANSDEVVLAGGRTRRLARDLISLATTGGLDVHESEQGPGLRQIRLQGSPQQLATLASRTGLDYVRSAANLILTELGSVRDLLHGASPEPEPLNWQVQSWSFDEMAWVDDRLPKTARQYSNRYGVTRYMVDLGRGLLAELSKRQAVFAAAFLRRKKLAAYDLDKQLLTTPIRAPFPELGARAACLASGHLPTIAHGNLQYRQVPVETAAVLLTSLGQEHPLQGVARRE